MSDLLKRAIRRQEAVRESRDLACILLAVLLPVAYIGLVGVLQSVEVAGTPLTAGGVVSAVVGIVAIWVAAHLAREVWRLGRLLKDPKRILRVDRDLDFETGVRWASLLPFIGKRS